MACKTPNQQVSDVFHWTNLQRHVHLDHLRIEHPDVHKVFTKIAILMKLESDIPSDGGAIDSRNVRGLDQNLIQALHCDWLGRRRIGSQTKLLFASVVIEIDGWSHLLDPSVLHTLDVENQPTQVGNRDRVARQYLRGEMETLIRISAGVGQQVRNGIGNPITKVGQRVAECFHDGDAGIVEVKVGPHSAGHLLQLADGLLPQ